MSMMGAVMKKTKKIEILRLFGPKYLSDNPCWNSSATFKGKVTLITSGMGTGKSTAMLKIAAKEQFLDKGEKMLFMTTRCTDAEKLRKKVERDEDLSKKVVVKTIQSLEEEIHRYDMTVDTALSTFKIVVCDEAHYWLTDGAFSESSPLSFDAVRAYANSVVGTDKMLFLMSATPERIENIFPVVHRVPGEIPTNHVKEIVFVPDADYVTQAMINIHRTIENNRKGIIFVRKKSDIEKILSELGVQADRCAVYTAACKPDCEADGRYEIPQDKNVIISTSVLAFGVDFTDPDIDFVMTNDVDPILAVQELGRRRCFGDKEVTYYVSDFEAEYLTRAYTKFQRFMAEYEMYSTSKEIFYGAGGAWYEAIFRKNRIFRTERHTESLVVDVAYKELCERFVGYISDLESGATTWKEMIISRLGFKSGSPAPVKPYQEVIDDDARDMLKRLESVPILTTDDWKMLGQALRVKNDTRKGKGTGYKYGDYISSPKKIDPIIRSYGYSAGERVRKRIDGKVVSTYPLIRLNDAEKDGES